MFDSIVTIEFKLSTITVESLESITSKLTKLVELTQIDYAKYIAFREIKKQARLRPCLLDCITFFDRHFTGRDFI